MDKSISGHKSVPNSNVKINVLYSVCAACHNCDW
uniref:Uncharacterized protein n=2 Tax=Anguilla anguilla TaxID=7936 RepID=A0A0E9R653_ANGAN